MSAAAPGPETRVYRPAELNREVRLHLEAGFPRLWIAGELSNVSRPASGHLYFTLKDARAQLRCALFRGNQGNLQGRPANGDQVLVRGRLSLYEPRGDYQLVADALLPAGAGALMQAFEALKKKLEAEGLFDPARKQPLPAFPRAIAVVTSPSGAALRDIRATLARRWPAAEVLVYPAQVQGEQAVDELLEALDHAERAATAQVLIVARGGGSMEDLQAFNDERLARRIAAIRIPVISGVGHETDFTICDFVADLRAATPTGAAEAATPDGPALSIHVRRLRRRLLDGQQRRMEQHAQRLDRIVRRLAQQHPARRLEQRRASLNSISRRLQNAAAKIVQRTVQRQRQLRIRLNASHPARAVAEHLRRRGELDRRLIRAERVLLDRAGMRLATVARALDAVSPLAVLGRGYALIEDAHGHLLSRREDFTPGQTLFTRVRDLRLVSTLDRIEPFDSESADTEPPDGAET